MGKNPVQSMRTADYDVLIDLLRDVREDAGVSQPQLSNNLSQAHHYIASIERGTRRLDIVEFIAVAKALNMPPEQLFINFLQRLPKADRYRHRRNL